jgi:hypothetical protein
MNSIDYKLSDVEKRDLISCCSILGSDVYNLNEISSLPYGYMFCFKKNGGYGSAFVVNIAQEKTKKTVDVLPDCKFAGRLREFLENYFNQKDLLL